MRTLKEARTQSGKTQEQLCDQVKISQDAWSNIELGKTSPQKATRRKIEEALGQRINWLRTKGFGREDGEHTSWESVEQKFRLAVLEIRSLPIGRERREFCDLARQYIKNLEEEEGFKKK